MKTKTNQPIPAKDPARKPFCYVSAAGKTVRREVLDMFASKEMADSKESSKELPPDLFVNNYGKDSLIQPLYNPEALARLLEINTYHTRCCKTKAQDTAGNGWKLKSLNDGANEDQKKLLEDFFKGMFPSVLEVLKSAMLDYEAVGYGAVEIIRQDNKTEGLPVALWHIPAHTLRVHKEGNRYLQQRGANYRWFKRVGYGKDVDKNTGEEVALNTLDAEKQASELLWFINYTPRSDFYGVPDIIPGIGAIQGDISRRDYNIAFFQNYGVPSYAVFISGNYDAGEPDPATGKTPLETAIESHFLELQGKPHSTLILSIPTSGRDGEVKVEFQPLSVETKEASFRLYRQDNMNEVLHAHGVPGYRIGLNETGSLGGNTASESTEIYKQSIISPRQEMLEASINRFIVWGAFEAYDWEFELEGIDLEDEIKDADLLAKLFLMGAVTPNQIINKFGKRFGLEPFPHPAMDAHYVNNAPIDMDLPAIPTELEATIKSLQGHLVDLALQRVK